jgi:hypothetical protein
MSAKTIEAHSLHAEPLTIELELPVTEAAFARVSPRLLAMDPATVRDARLDLTVAAAVALAGAENVLSRRAALAQSFRDVPWSVLEGIEDLAHAAQHADLLHRAAQDTTVNFADILPRANELRGMLLLDLAAQVRRKRAPERLVEDVRAGDNSVRDKANDLNEMAGWYRAHWSEVEGRTSVESAEVDEAAALATRMLARLGSLAAAQRPGEGTLGSEELRRRAFTALLGDYDTVRRFGAFLFWSEPEGWDAFVPSIGTSRVDTRGA